MTQFDVVVIGAGAAGMMCAIEAGRRGRRVLVLEHNDVPGEKIRISGGGRCNFTNSGTVAKRFVSGNGKFAISALSRFRPDDFIALVKRYEISFHEKTLGQLFCDGSAKQIIAMLQEEMVRANVVLRCGVSVGAVAQTESGFTVICDGAQISAEALVIATGGKSIPKMGATGFGYGVAQQFGLRLTDTQPGLVPLTFDPDLLADTAPLSGVSLEVVAKAGKASFREAMLFTHRGLSGPAILQISSFWTPGETIEINLAPDVDVLAALKAARAAPGKQEVVGVLSMLLPKRLAQLIAEPFAGRIAEKNDKALQEIAERVTGWRVKPTGTEGYRTAEVTLGGVDTADLDAKTMMARQVAGLYFVGEVVDVTGWLGGYNFQWAWSSGWAAGQVV